MYMRRTQLAGEKLVRAGSREHTRRSKRRSWLVIRKIREEKSILSDFPLGDIVYDCRYSPFSRRGSHARPARNTDSRLYRVT